MALSRTAGFAFPTGSMLHCAPVVPHRALAGAVLPTVFNLLAVPCLMGAVHFIFRG